MPKLKTSKTASKRLSKLTAGGTPLRRRRLAQHLVRRKTRRNIKASGEKTVFSLSEGKKIIKLNPYGKK